MPETSFGIWNLIWIVLVPSNQRCKWSLPFWCETWPSQMLWYRHWPVCSLSGIPLHSPVPPCHCAFAWVLCAPPLVWHCSTFLFLWWRLYWHWTKGIDWGGVVVGMAATAAATATAAAAAALLTPTLAVGHTTMEWRCEWYACRLILGYMAPSVSLHCFRHFCLVLCTHTRVLLLVHFFFILQPFLFWSMCFKTFGFIPIFITSWGWVVC